MPIIVLFAALAMPLTGWLSSRGAFGPDNATLAARYPNLLAAAGYAFAIWGLIYLLDLAWALWQASAGRRYDRALRTVRLPVAIGFALTAAWPVAFGLQAFWLALAIIWANFACLLHAALLLRDSPDRRLAGLPAAPIALHAGWLGVAACLNTAQVIVAYRLLPGIGMAAWSLALLAAAVLLLGLASHRLRGHPAFAAAAAWGLAAVAAKQSVSPQAGAAGVVGLAAAAAVLLVAQAAWWRWRGPRPGGRRRTA